MLCTMYSGHFMCQCEEDQSRESFFVAVQYLVKLDGDYVAPRIVLDVSCVPTIKRINTL